MQSDTEVGRSPLWGHEDPPIQPGIRVAGGALGVLFLIPLRRYFVRETHKPPIEAMRRQGVHVAGATKAVTKSHS